VLVFIIAYILSKVVGTKCKSSMTLVEYIHPTHNFLAKGVLLIECYNLVSLHRIYSHIEKVHTYNFRIQEAFVKKSIYGR
jgi:hypothetical protein